MCFNHRMDILIIGPFMLTGKWRSVNGVRFGDPSVLFGVPNYIDITIKTTRVNATTFANQMTLQQGLPKLRRDR